MNAELRSSPLLVIVAGPPLSGKSSLAESLLAGWTLSPLVGASADEVKRVLMPGGGTSLVERDDAYSIIHYVAGLCVRQDVGVLLDATYGRTSQRLALAQNLSSWVNEIVLIQCAVTPDEARRRLLTRGKHHPATDLTETRVRRDAQEYDYRPDGLLLSSDLLTLADMTSMGLQAIQAGPSVSLDEWARGGRSDG